MSTGSSHTKGTVPVEYYPANKLRPNNLDLSKDSLHETLVIMFGKRGAIIETKEYLFKPTPIRPDILESLDTSITSSAEYRHASELYKDDVKTVNTFNALSESMRSSIFGVMFSHISHSARDRLSTHPSYPQLIADADDPISLWNLVETLLNSAIISNVASSQGASRESYSEWRQTQKMSTVDFHKGFKHRYHMMLANGCEPLSDTMLAYDYTHKLCTHRYARMINCIENGLLDMPTSLETAWELSLRWKNLPGDEGSSYLSHALKKDVRPLRPIHADRISSQRDAILQLKVNALASGFSPGSCFNCGDRNHTMQDCPTYPHSASLRLRSKRTPVPKGKSRKKNEAAYAKRSMENNAQSSFKASKRELTPNTVGLDSMCSAHIMGNTNLLTDIEECPPIHFNGIGGHEVVHRRGKHPAWGWVYIREGDQRVNLLSLSMLEQSPGYKIRYSQSRGIFSVIDKKGGVHEFSRKNGKLYVCNLDDHHSMAAESSIVSVEGNSKLHSLKDIKLAERAKLLSAALGHASRDNLHRLVRNGRVAGIGITSGDIRRAHDIFGESVEIVRGKSVQRKTKFAEPVVGKVVEPNLVMHTDLMFVCGVPFLVSIFKPLMLTLSTFIRSKNAIDVKKAIDHQVSILHSEGFKVVEITSDGEGAVGAIKESLDSLGCRVTIHSKSTHSADIDIKIRELKNMMRACSVWHSEFPHVLISALVSFCVSKVNMMPSRVNAHGFSPMEQFLGRSISIDRDLGGKGGNGPLAFGTRVEIFDKTSNTMADRTSPALFLGSKGNSFGSALFFKLDTETIVSSDQWKALPMDAGTISRINEIARRGRPFPKKLVLYYGNRVVSDNGVHMASDPSADTIAYQGREVIDTGRVMPTGNEILPDTDLPGERIVVRADDAPFDHNISERGAQLQETSSDEAAVEIRGADTSLSPEVPVDLGGGDIAEVPAGSGGENKRDDTYHYPVLEDSSRNNPVGAPWFLHGSAISPSNITASGRPKRDTRRPNRYGFDALLSNASLNGRTPTRPNGGRNRSQQAKLEARRSKHESAYILAVDRAIEQFGEKALNSLEKELTGLEEKSVFEQVMYDSLTVEQRKKIIRSKMFLKEKFLPDGTFDKLKSRLVAGGDMQLREDYNSFETSSPTVALSSVYMVLGVGAKERRKMGTADVGMAYLNAGISKDVFMKIEGALAEMLVRLFPTKYKLDKGGKIFVKLKKALYGCIESAKLWYDMISKALNEMGFTANPHDPCVFNAQRNGHQVTICLYVDDLLITSVDEDDIDWVADDLRKRYGTVTLNKGDVHSYLGQTFDLSIEGEVSVSMEGYTKDILSSQPVKGTRLTPAAVELYSVNEELPVLPALEQDLFHSLVMKLMFLAQRARPDILTPVSFLSRRWGKATAEDKEKLDRVLMYLNLFPDLKMTICCEKELRVYCYVDASFGVHNDMKSHTGGIISLGSGAVHVSSKKQQLMTKSSTEAELVGMSDQLPQAIWTRNFLIAQGYKMGPTRIYQDNMSTIALAEKGRSTSARTRHVSIRYFFVKDRIESGDVEIEYLPTEDMRADIMTKPLQGELFRKMRADLMGFRDYVRSAKGEGDTTAKPFDA